MTISRRAIRVHGYWSSKYRLESETFHLLSTPIAPVMITSYIIIIYYLSRFFLHIYFSCLMLTSYIIWVFYLFSSTYFFLTYTFSLHIFIMFIPHCRCIFLSPYTRNLAHNAVNTCSQSLLYRKCMCTCPVPTTPVLQMPNWDQKIEDWRPISHLTGVPFLHVHLFIDYNYSFDIITHCCYSCRLINHKHIAPTFYIIQVPSCSIFIHLYYYMASNGHLHYCCVMNYFILTLLCHLVMYFYGLFCGLFVQYVC